MPDLRLPLHRAAERPPFAPAIRGRLLLVTEEEPGDREHHSVTLGKEARTIERGAERTQLLTGWKNGDGTEIADCYDTRADPHSRSSLRRRASQ